MSYTKVIQSGDLVERYDYDGNPPTPPGERRLSKKHKRGRVAPREYDQLSEEGRADWLHKRRADSINRARNAFRRLVRANLFVGHPVLLTLTMLDLVDIAEAYSRFSAFGQKMRRTFGVHLSWIAVPEFQTRGAVHFHVLMWNLPYELVETEKDTRRIQNIWAWGYVDLTLSDGSPKLSTYLAKYMSKTMSDSRLLGKRAYCSSRNILRPVSLNSPSAIDQAFEVWGITNDIMPEREFSYETRWMGTAHYKSYSLQGMTAPWERDTMSP